MDTVRGVLLSAAIAAAATFGSVVISGFLWLGYQWFELRERRRMVVARHHTGTDVPRIVGGTDVPDGVELPSFTEVNPQRRTL